MSFTFTDARTGKPYDGLKPYLAAAGHVVVLREDGGDFAHEHAEGETEDGEPVFALPGTTFGPELDAHFHFHTAGTYQLWAQFRLATGDVVTVPFTVEAH
jgi:Cu+-exporting ATPase